MKKTIITVVGKDTVGIIAKICTYLANNRVNILDISQTIVQDFFNMMMIVNLEANTMSFDELVDSLNELGKALEVDIRLQHEQIFDSMHRI